MKNSADDRYKGKRILLICPTNNGYPYIIKSVLEDRGATVHLYDERGNPNNLEKLLYRKAPGLASGKIEKYYTDIIQNESTFDPDALLLICPEAINSSIISKMKKVFFNTIFIVYLWDSIENKAINIDFRKFDVCFSFDRIDCKKYGLKFRPLFFAREYYKSKIKMTNEFKYDIGFIGTLHSDRPEVINGTRKYSEDNGLKYYFYFCVQSKLILLYWLIKSRHVRELFRLNMIHLKTLPLIQAKKEMEHTRCVVDINHPKQSGLTMRTIEMVGLQRKLITTNNDIQNYEFYNPVNQMIIDKSGNNINKYDLKTPYEKIPDSVYEKYSVDFWLDEVLHKIVNCER